MKTRTKPLFAATLILVNVINLFIIARHFYYRGSSNAEERKHTYLGRDFPHTLPLPAVDPVALTFDSESAQYPVEGEASDLEWLFLTSANVGWARLGPSNRLLHPSYYHEIHCIRMLNQALFRVESPYTTMAHSRHCLHYLRVLALCNADLVLEPVTRVNGSAFEWDTAQATHTCRDWSALYTSMEKNWDDWKVYNASHPL